MSPWRGVDDYVIVERCKEVRPAWRQWPASTAWATSSAGGTGEGRPPPSGPSPETTIRRRESNVMAIFIICLFLTKYIIY